MRHIMQNSLKEDKVNKVMQDEIVCLIRVKHSFFHSFFNKQNTCQNAVVQQYAVDIQAKTLKHTQQVISTKYY